jgi:hypothetical protein
MEIWIYKHYKGNTYQILALGKHSDTLENYVIYQGLYNSEKFGNKPIRVKSVEEFEKDIKIDGQKIKRFVYLGK